jgi:hypothetical protein
LNNGGNITTPRVDEYCRLESPVSANTQVKFAGTYNLPWKITAAATFQNVPGIPITAAFAAPAATVANSLGRNPNSAVTVQLMPNVTRYTERINQLDFRTTRLFPLGSRARIRAHLDLYNLLNSSGIQGVNTTYGSKWLTPTSIVQGRLLKLAAQIDF